jgi:hypothetical protein
MTKREQLLEELYQVWWEESATMDSDLPGYAYMTYDAFSKLDRICEQIEEIDNARH